MACWCCDGDKQTAQQRGQPQGDAGEKAHALDGVHDLLVTMSWQYIGKTIFNMLVLVGLVKGAERIVKEMFGL